MTSPHLHLMGIGGVGMCGLAEVLLAEGCIVSGCDVAASERTQRLATLGASVHLGHGPDHLDSVDVLVVSSAVSADSPEVVAASDRRIPVARRAEMLAELMRSRRGIAVAGTHGKTTTTALVGHLLIAAGSDPTVIVGGRAHGLGAHARCGRGPILVCEADEFDRSFLELQPEVAVITNLEREHLDCYGDERELAQAFVAFANRASVFGVVVLCADDPGASSLRPAIRRRTVTYGSASDADLRFEVATADAAGTDFRVTRDRQELGTVHLRLPGLFNVRNAMAAVAVGLELGHEFSVLADACSQFTGVARRFHLRGERAGVTVVDDYAHHPTEIEAVLEATRQALPGRRIVAVFQPHLYSRTRDFAEGFARALLGADVAVVLPIYPAREQPLDGVSSQLVVDEAGRLGHPAVLAGLAPHDVMTQLGELLRPGDVLLTLGAGDVDRVAEKWLREAS